MTGLLKNHALNCRSKPNLAPYLAILHVKDAVIPLADRQADVLYIQVAA